jgi:hypothetical protein
MTVRVSRWAEDGMVPSRAKEDKMKSRSIIFAIVVFGSALLVGTATAQLSPLGLKAYGERLQGEARVYQQLEKGPTALGLKAWGERLQAEARVYQQRRSEAASSPAGGFDWSDAGIGALLGFALAAGCVGALLVGRRFRHTQFAAF